MVEKLWPKNLTSGPHLRDLHSEGPLRETNFYNLPPTYITIAVVYYAIDTPFMATIFGGETDHIPNNFNWRRESCRCRISSNGPIRRPPPQTIYISIVSYNTTTIYVGYSISDPPLCFLIGGYIRWWRTTDEKSTAVDHIYKTFIVRVHYIKIRVLRRNSVGGHWWYCWGR